MSHQLPAPDQAIQLKHIHPHAQLQESPQWGLREAAGLKELKLMLPKPITIKKTNNQATCCHPQDLVPAPSGEWILRQITPRKCLFIVITSIGKQADL